MPLTQRPLLSVAQLKLLLRTGRKRARITQAELALRLNTSQARISQLEKDPDGISAGLLLKWFQQLGLELSYATKENAEGNDDIPSPVPSKESGLVALGRIPVATIPAPRFEQDPSTEIVSDSQASIPPADQTLTAPAGESPGKDLHSLLAQLDQLISDSGKTATRPSVKDDANDE